MCSPSIVYGIDGCARVDVLWYLPASDGCDDGSDGLFCWYDKIEPSHELFDGVGLVAPTERRTRIYGDKETTVIALPLPTSLIIPDLLPVLLQVRQHESLGYLFVNDPEYQTASLDACRVHHFDQHLV